ncbi:MAG: PAS domain S-box protein, partial [Chloroflexota bacterium]
MRANRAAQDYYGYTEQQFQRLTIHRINMLGREEIEQKLKEVIAHHRNYFVFRHRLANGDIRDVEVFSSPIQLDGRTCLLSIISDIGVYVSMERHGHQLVQEYHALFERIPDGVYRSTPQGRLLTANPALVRMLGYASVEELLKVDITRDLYMDSAERQQFLLELDQKEEPLTASIRLRRKDGSILTVLDNSRTVRDKQGEVQYYEGVLTDITELLQVEETLARRVNELELLYEHGLTLSMTLEPHQVAR